MRTLPLLLALLAVGCDGKQDDTAPSDTEPDECPPPEEDHDGDCFAEPEDCDDSNPYVYPGADEVPYDGIDNDCAGDGDLTDWDGDGYDGEMAGGDDCNDSNPEYHPGAEETCIDRYHGRDPDCDGTGQTDDCDGDGYDRWEDCVEDDPAFHPGAEEVWYDGIDGDCDTLDDYDADQDGQQSAEHVEDADDCNDQDPTVYYGAAELWDDQDNDCDGVVDLMAQLDAPVEWVGNFLEDGDVSFGETVKWTQDWDGDGLRDAIVSAPWSGIDADKKVTYDGRIYLLSGQVPPTDSTPVSNAMATISGTSALYLGWDMDVMDDLDGDGLDEIVAGSPTYSVAGATGAGLVFLSSDVLHYGDVSANDAWASFYGETYYGIDLAVIGDVTGDGYEEVAISAGEYDENGRAQISVFSGADLAAGGDWGADSTALAVMYATGYAGKTAAGGDFDGDGLPEMIAGSGCYDWDDKTGALTPDTGKLYLVSGQDIADGGTMSSAAQATFEGDGASDMAGWRGGWTWDADGDGYDEVLVSFPGADAVETQAGVVYVMTGPDAMAERNPASTALLTIEGDTEYGFLAGAEEPADFDGDGLGDLAVSNLGDTYSDVKGYTWVFFADQVAAGGTVPASSARAGFATKYEDDRFGWTSSFADQEGDGDTDVLIGAPFAQAGQAWIHLNALP